MKREHSSRRREWTSRETARLLDARKRGKSYAQCASMFGRTKKQISNKLHRLGATNGNSLKGKRQYEIRWTKREETVMRRYYAEIGPSAIAERIGRTAKSIYAKAHKMGLASAKPRWSYRDVISILIESVPLRRLNLISTRTLRAIRLLRNRLRGLHTTNRLNAYLEQRPGAPAKCRRFGAQHPPGLKFVGVRLTEKGKAKRAREYIARQAERERQKSATRKWQARRIK